MSDLIERDELIAMIQEKIQDVRSSNVNTRPTQISFTEGLMWALRRAETLNAVTTKENINNWVLCKDGLPEYDVPVLVSGNRSGVYSAVYKQDYGWWKLNSRVHFCQPIAWMYLPEPCKKRK